MSSTGEAIGGDKKEYEMVNFGNGAVRLNRNVNVTPFSCLIQTVKNLNGLCDITMVFKHTQRQKRKIIVIFKFFFIFNYIIL